MEDLSRTRETPRIQQEVDAAHDFYLKVFENFPALIWRAGVDAGCNYFNRAWLSFTGRTLEQELGDGWVESVHPDDADHCSRTYRTAFQARRPFTIEYRLRRYDGVYRWIVDNGQPFMDHNDHFAGYIGSCYDITERKEMEESIQHERDKLRRILHGLPDGVCIITQDFDLDYANPVLENDFGSARGKKCYEYFLDRSSACPWCRHDEIFNGRNLVWEWYSYKTGKTYQIFDTPVREKDGAVYRLEILYNITERKLAEKERLNLEAQLMQAQKMETVGRLAGGVAHDFNNLLSPILGYSEMLLEDLPPDSPSVNAIQAIQQAGERAKDLTRQLLAFGRKQVLEMSVLNVNTIISEFGKMIGRLIGEDIRMVTHLDPSIGPIRADGGQIEQVLLNLAVNARDAMPEGGTLTIETAEVDLDEEYARKKPGVIPGRYVLLAVSDVGCGMSEETRANIFEPFFTTKEKGKGTGLGLSTVYGIVKQHGGNVWVYSEEGKGTTFKVYLPRVDETPTDKRVASAERIALSGHETVLVVEDEEAVREMVRRVLGRLGYHVLDAAGGAEALRIANEYRDSLHLVVTDVIMPGMNGRETFDRVASAHPEARVIFMSGYAEDVIAHHGVLDQGIHFIQKPFSVQHLARKVRDVLDE